MIHSVEEANIRLVCRIGFCGVRHFKKKMVMKNVPKRFILASQSPRRRRMLRDMGLNFEIMPSDIEEILLDGEKPDEHTLRLSKEKAEFIAADNPDALVLGVDTAVVVDEHILGKPADAPEAEKMLGMIAGRFHVVFSSYTLIGKDAGIFRQRAVSTRVEIRPLSAERIRWYIQTGESMDKAGAYAIQGIGASLVRGVKGSYSCVVGLPLAELMEDIEELLGPNWIFEL